MKYCWLDIETTGLNKSNNEVVEIAAIITNGLFEKVDQFHAIVKPSNKCIWQQEVVEMHYNTGLLKEILASTKSLEQVLPELITFLKKNAPEKGALVPAGNTVHFDTEFLIHCIPEIDSCLSHRHLDVSSIRIAVVEMYGPEARAPKTSTHRALEDLAASMQELEFYKQNYFKPVLKSDSII